MYILIEDGKAKLYCFCGELLQEQLDAGQFVCPGCRHIVTVQQVLDEADKGGTALLDLRGALKEAVPA